MCGRISPLFLWTGLEIVASIRSVQGNDNCPRRLCICMYSGMRLMDRAVADNEVGL